MATSAESSRTRTSLTLLLGLRDMDNDAAWRRFVDVYTPRIYGWCRRKGLSGEESVEVTQLVLTKMVGALRQFEYNPARGTFRAWLCTVTRNAVREFYKEFRRPDRGSGDTQVHHQLSAVHDPEAKDQLEQALIAQGQLELLREAEERVQRRVAESTWNAWILLTREQMKPADAAASLSIRITDVYVAKSRIIKMLRHTIALLDGRSGEQG